MRLLDTPHALELRGAMDNAANALAQAEKQYQEFLLEGVDLADITAVRNAGRGYAQAITHYSYAAMAWLAYVDKYCNGKRAS